MRSEAGLVCDKPQRFSRYAPRPARKGEGFRYEVERKKHHIFFPNVMFFPSNVDMEGLNVEVEGLHLRVELVRLEVQRLNMSLND